MAPFHQISRITLPLLTILVSTIAISHQQVLDSAEQSAVYSVLDSVDPAVPWRSLFPDDLCLSAPHGVACDYFSADPSSPATAHVTQLSFGFVSDYSPNPPCSGNSTLSPLVFTAFKYLRKLFFYQCFAAETRVSVPEIPAGFGSYLEELVFIDNPSLAGPLSGILRNFTSLRRVVLTGNGFYGTVPDGVADLVNLEELTLSRNRLGGEISADFGRLSKLKILDLGSNFFAGNAPESVGKLAGLLKLDLSSNGFSGKIPETLGNLKSLELLDLSNNGFRNSGIPLFLGEMPELKQVYLSGNMLGGEIPEIWENLEGILGIGLSGNGLVGKIPASMGLHLKRLSYLGLENNRLEGTVPMEFGLLESVHEINLENNSLSGQISISENFSAGVVNKLKLAGNPNLCADEGLVVSKLGKLNLKVCNKTQKPKSAIFTGESSSAQVAVVVVAPSVLTFTTWVLVMIMFA